jgi:DNA-binding FadR family transcriptional regulator
VATARHVTTSRRRPSGRRKLATLVRERLMAEIWAGRWRPGDRLPTEPEMAALFGVSRTPIREAMQSLSLLGVVNVSPRRGATVQALPVESVVDLAILSGAMAPERSADDVLAFRLAMESASAELAAANARDEDLAQLRSIVADNVAAFENGDTDAANDADIRFHAAIAEASGNVVFTSVAHVLNGLLVELRKSTGGVPGASDASLAEHQAIMAALDRRDGTAARLAAAEHIENTRTRFHARHTERVPAESAALNGRG